MKSKEKEDLTIVQKMNYSRLLEKIGKVVYLPYEKWLTKEEFYVVNSNRYMILLESKEDNYRIVAVCDNKIRPIRIKIVELDNPEKIIKQI